MWGTREEVAVSQPYVVRYVGGPLDGRVDSHARPPEAPKQTVTHVHLHDGPKVVHRYDLQPLTAHDTVRALAEAGVTSFAMEAIPRITRAQSMDALSSMATIAGFGVTPAALS